MEVIAVVQYGRLVPPAVPSLMHQSSYDQPVTIYDSTPELSGLSLASHIQASFSTRPDPAERDLCHYQPRKIGVTVTTDGTSLPFANSRMGLCSPPLTCRRAAARW